MQEEIFYCRRIKTDIDREIFGIGEYMISYLSFSLLNKKILFLTLTRTGGHRCCKIIKIKEIYFDHEISIFIIKRDNNFVFKINKDSGSDFIFHEVFLG